jgi:ferritin-like metal-binding protein YciE
MTVDTVGKKFTHDLGDIYDAEQRFLEAQEKMLQQASSPLLREMLSEHIAQTHQQIANLDTVYLTMNVEPQRGNCTTAASLVEEGDALIRDSGTLTSMLDSVIASAIGKVEHFEIASYRNLITTAERFDQPAVVDLLRRNLEQEETAAGKAEDGYRKLLEYAISTQRLQTAVGERGPLL